MQGFPLPGTQIHPLLAPKRKPTGYIADPDKGIDYHRIPDKYKQVSELVAIKNDAERHNKLRLARDMAATEVINFGNKAGGVKKTEEEKTRYRNIKENLSKYYKNIDAYYGTERLLIAKPTEETGFQTSSHPYKMTKDGK